ncbi:hypothetical protein LSAT2_000605 [Lamellibrachia satsuma]|nr:hypothetical protein LSAT2_000605 [Lamellibrachia satsuma]
MHHSQNDQINLSCAIRFALRFGTTTSGDKRARDALRKSCSNGVHARLIKDGRPARGSLARDHLDNSTTDSRSVTRGTRGVWSATLGHNDGSTQRRPICRVLYETVSVESLLQPHRAERRLVARQVMISGT